MPAESMNRRVRLKPRRLAESADNDFREADDKASAHYGVFTPCEGQSRQNYIGTRQVQQLANGQLDTALDDAGRDGIAGEA